MNLLNLVLVTCAFATVAQAKEIALTFDDSPRHAKGYLDGPTRAKKLISSLKGQSVKEVAFFSVSSQLDTEGTTRIKAYADAGHIIANHTHTHPNFNETLLDEFISDFRTAHRQLSKIKNFEQWFRFPQLREGNDLAKRDGMRRVMSEAGYLNAYITINNYDWYMEQIFQRKIKEGVKLDFVKLKKFYISVLLEAVEYYEQMAQLHLGRSPKHIILLHETDLNALFVEDFITELRTRQWSIISPREAYQDAISRYKTDTLLKGNPGRIGEIAKDKGQTSGLWHETCDESYLETRFAKEVL